MVEWLVADDKLEKWDAYETVSGFAQIRVGDIVDPSYGVVVKTPKRYLPYKVASSKSRDQASVGIISVCSPDLES